MPKRKNANEERNLPASFSIRPSLKYEFKVLCYNLKTDPSKEIQKFIEKFIEKNKNLVPEKKQ